MKIFDNKNVTYVSFQLKHDEEETKKEINKSKFWYNFWILRNISWTPGVAFII